MSSPVDDIARDEFRSLALTLKQVARIEDAFPLIEVLATRTDQPPNREVRETLDDLRKSALAAERVIRRLSPPTTDQVSGAASRRLQQCLFDQGERDPTTALRQACQLFGAIADAADNATGLVPQEQARRRVDPEPVQLIVRALQDGWADDHMVVRDSFGAMTDDAPEAPPIPCSGTRGAKEALKRVVAAVYDLIGRRAHDGVAPAWERTYRAYDTAQRRIRS